MLNDSARHLIEAGGKRVRPALTLLFADTVTPDCDDAVTAAVACELVHLGSLHHDDVIDEASTRRGVPTVNVSWSNTVAVLSGDFLLGRASQLAASLGAEPAAILADTIAALAAGEILELENLFSTSVAADAYYASITDKTASLMGTACRLGVVVAGASDTAAAQATSFGIELGLVFQIVDDVLDVIGDEAQTGKQRGIDLVEGVYTLPTLLALQNDSDRRLHKLLRPEPTPHEVDEAIELIVALGGPKRAVEIAAKHLARCDAILDTIPACAAREALGRLSRYVLERTMLDF